MKKSLKAAKSDDDGDNGGGGECGNDDGCEDVDKIEWLILSCLRGLSDR